MNKPIFVIKRKKIITTIILLLLMNHSFAKDLGTIGNVYPILEPDLLQVIENQLLLMQKSGELDQLTQTFNQTIQQKMDRPTPVEGLRRTHELHTWLFDPSIKIPYDLKDRNGNVLLSAGSTINPLNTIRLSEALLFYNADDPDQVSWAIKRDQDLKGNDKLILVGGSIFDQIKRFHRPVYFDQNGKLIAHFQIKQIPAIVTQQNDRLKIEEVLP